MKIRAIIVFKRNPSNHWCDEVAVFELVRDKELYWECQDEADILSSFNYDKRRLLAKRLAAKYKVDNIIYVDRYYPIRKTIIQFTSPLSRGRLCAYRCKFYKKDLKH